MQPGDLINGRPVRDILKPKPARAAERFSKAKLPPLPFANGTITIRFEQGPPAYKWPKAELEVQRP